MANTEPRPSWDDIWDAIATQVSFRSLCVQAQVGAVITDSHNHIVSTGYNGPPAGFNHKNLPCNVWCSRSLYPHIDRMLCPSVHAEANALLSADRSRWKNGTMFVNKHPCWECSKLIANSGLTRLVVKPIKTTPAGHHSEQTYDFLELCGLTVEVLE